MELDLSLGDLSKDNNSKHQNASINNNKDDGLVFCMALGLNSTVGNQESHKPHQTYDHNDDDDDDDDDHPLHPTLQDRDRTDDHQEKFMGTAHLQLDRLPLSAVPLHTCGPLLPTVAWSNSIKIRECSTNGLSRQLGLVLQLAVGAGGAAEEVVLSANNMVEAERASSKASTDEDENGHNSRKKLRLSKQQSASLEKNFREHSTLNPKQKLALANQLNLRPRQVEVWYQNRRARNKLKQTEVDCEYLKRFCDTLTEANIRLQKEIQELRALNSSNPLYMQLPATTLAMCPSCEQVATTSTTSHPHN